MCNRKPFDYALVGSVNHYCTLHSRVQIETPPLKAMFFSHEEMRGQRGVPIRLTRVCQHCGTEFKAAGHREQFCSHKCKFQKLAIPCGYCKTLFLPAHIAKPTKTCSRHCGNKLHSLTKKKKTEVCCV